MVENFLGGDSADVLLTKFNETLMYTHNSTLIKWIIDVIYIVDGFSSYRRVEASVEQRRRNLDSKIPELKKAVKAVQMLRQPSVPSNHFVSQHLLIYLDK